VRVNIHVLHADLAATGGTLSRGLNRIFATLLAVFLAIGAHMAANLCGENGEPILLSVFVFLVGTYAAGPSMFTTTNCISTCYFSVFCDRALARVAERQVWLLAGQSSLPSGSEFPVRMPRDQVRVPVRTVL
jgi:hypothetical protein